MLHHTQRRYCVTAAQTVERTDCVEANVRTLKLPVAVLRLTVPEPVLAAHVLLAWVVHVRHQVALGAPHDAAAEGTCQELRAAGGAVCSTHHLWDERAGDSQR